MSEEYREKVRRGVLDEANFVRLTLKGKHPGQDVPWRKVVVRPVLLKAGRHLQFSYFDEKKDITKNHRGTEAEEKLDEVLALPFSHIHLESSEGDLQVQVTRDGKAIFHRGKPASKTQQPDLLHDRRKALPLPPGKPDAFLQAVGIMNKQGQVVPSMADKLHQINEFLKLLEHTGELKQLGATKPTNILDCGSGSSYLSFAVYHYLNDVLGIPSRLVGIDSNAELIDKSNANASQLGFSDICFFTSAIRDYTPEPGSEPNIVLALHACDTATDDALAQGIKWGAKLILAVPCCHHHLHAQMQKVEPFGPVMREGILKKRLADILTDTFRSLALRICGYRTDVVEFVSSEHTDRNLMIRAVRSADKGPEDVLREYTALKEFWHVVPYIEALLAGEHLWPDAAKTIL